jgi:hypothetical protein
MSIISHSRKQHPHQLFSNSSLTEIAKRYRFEVIIYGGDRRNDSAFYTKCWGVDEHEFGYDRVRGEMECQIISYSHKISY